MVLARGNKQHVQRLKAAKEALSARFIRPSGLTHAAAGKRAVSRDPAENVVGVGIAEKISDGKRTGVLAVRVLVRHKFPKAQISARDMLPPTFKGAPVDIVEAGLIRP